MGKPTQVVTDDKQDEMIEFVFLTAENTVRRGENTDYQHFLLFPEGFNKWLSPTSW